MQLESREVRGAAAAVFVSGRMIYSRIIEVHWVV
jgi:hypothetical protein